MPILRTEIARIDLTPDEILLVDRMGRRYVQASRKELKSMLPKKATFARLEKLLYEAARPGAKLTAGSPCLWHVHQQSIIQQVHIRMLP